MSHLSEERLAELAVSERNRAVLPLTNWDSLSARLRDEGIIRDPRRSVVSGSGWMRAAAAVMLVAAGAVAGRYAIPASTPRPAAPAQSVTPVRAVSNDAPQNFASPEEAWSVLNRAGEEYQRASAYLAASGAQPNADSSAVYQTRLAALDEMTSATRAAMYSAPHDPVINQYYMAAMGAREATLRQLQTSLPTNVRLDRF